MSAVAQLDLFAAKQARDRALEQALSTPHVLYKEQLQKALANFALDPEPFTSDHLRREVGDPPAGCSPNIAGAVVMAALKRNVIREVGWTRSKRVIGHANKIGLYVGAGFAS